MLSYIIKRLSYGVLVLIGVVSLVFMIFSFVPDPARELAGQNESEEVVQAIRKKLGLDLPVGRRYLLFLNDLSPISLHHSDPEARSCFINDKYEGTLLSQKEGWSVAVKKPYTGRSFISNRKVSSIISEALPGTILLAVVAIGFAFVIGVLLGMFSAINKDKGFDKYILFFTSIGMSGPSFFMAILIAWIGAVLLRDIIPIPFSILIIPTVFAILKKKVEVFKRLKLGWIELSAFTWLILMILGIWITPLHSLMTSGFGLPGTGLKLTGSLYSVDVWEGRKLDLRNLILPAITLGIRPLAVIIQLTRSSMLDVLQQDYIRTAYAKGLSKTQVLFKHALRNALNPVVTAASGWFSSMLAGAVFVEFVFGWKGLGLEVFQSLEKNDLPVVLGAVLVIATTFVLINIIVDVIYGWIDPRARVNG